MSGPLRRDVPHGTRARYMQGCLCDACRAGSAQYMRERRARARATARTATSGARPGDLCPGVTRDGCPRGRRLRAHSVAGLCKDCGERRLADPLVSVDRVRAHLLELARAGLGRRAISDASDVSATLLRQLRRGERTHLRTSTERRILDVDASAVADRALVPASATHRRIRQLVRVHGFTLTEIARRLGRRGRHLKLGREVIHARTAHKVARLLADAEGDFLDEVS